MSKYDDIINLERPISKKRTPMTIHNRAAQFAPFSALVGYSEAVKEMARLTDNRINLSDEIKTIINEKLNYIKNNIKTVGEISITYFVEDIKKRGGKYVTVTGNIRKIDSNNKWIYMTDGLNIAFDDISDVTGDIFNFLEM